MTTIQLIALVTLAIVGIAVLFCFGLLTMAYLNYRRSQKEQRSLLARLENNPMLTATDAPRKKYNIFWSQ